MHGHTQLCLFRKQIGETKQTSTKQKPQTKPNKPQQQKNPITPY